MSFEKIIFNRLTTIVDKKDNDVRRYLRDNLGRMVDGARVGVWGRGYGAGAAALLAAEDARNVTRCLAALAPLADLRHHSQCPTRLHTHSPSA